MLDHQGCGGPHAAGHVALYPTQETSFTDFSDRVSELDWSHDGKKK